MKLITNEQRKRLLANGARQKTDRTFDPFPVVKLFALFVPWTWLLTSLDPEDPDRAYGLSDLGSGSPTIGPICLSELAEIRVGPAPVVQRDRLFEAVAPLSVYAEKAFAAGKII